MVVVYLCMCCTAAPRIPRPSDKQFIKYAEEGKTEQVAEALLHYPDLVNVADHSPLFAVCFSTWQPPRSIYVLAVIF